MMTLNPPKIESLGEAARFVREDLGISGRKLAALMQQDHTWLQKREIGELRMKPSDLRLIAKALGVAPEYIAGLVGTVGVNHQIRDNQGQLLNRSVVGHVASASRSGVGVPGGMDDSIPVLNRGKAGIILDYESATVEIGRDTASEYIDRGEVAGDNLFALVVVGRSMEPKLMQGDYIVMQRVDAASFDMASISDGKVVLVRTASDTAWTLTRWYTVPGNRSMIRLSKVDGGHMPRIIDREAVIGLALAVQRRESM